MVDVFRAERALVYYNLDKLTPDQIKSYTGFTHGVNGGFFNTQFKPTGWAIVDGNVISSDEFRDWCLAVDWKGKPCLSTDRSMPYLLSAVPIIVGGKKVYRNLTPDVKRPAERTVVCRMRDGSWFLWCDKAIMTREELQDALLAYGVYDALMMDGGGSTQGDFKGKKVTSSRKVATWCLFWEQGSSRPACPYAMPTKNVGKWAVGNNVKWMQWMLNQHGYGLKCDGIRGKNTNKALLMFQKRHGLEPDEVCGAKTKEELMKCTASK